MRRARIFHQGRDAWTTARDDGETLHLASGATVRASEAQWLPPITPGASTYALGLNYADHNRELGFAAKQAVPLIFLKGTLHALQSELQAVAPYAVEPVARVPVGDPAIIKQYLDIGFRTLLVPMMESAEQASATVAATRFPLRGVSGVASATSRASGFGADAAYPAQAYEKVTVIVQIESRAGLNALDEIAAVDGVDALFIGPADLAASLGYLGAPFSCRRLNQPVAEVARAGSRSWRSRSSSMRRNTVRPLSARI